LVDPSDNDAEQTGRTLSKVWPVFVLAFDLTFVAKGGRLPCTFAHLQWNRPFPKGIRSLIPDQPNGMVRPSHWIFRVFRRYKTFASLQSRKSSKMDEVGMARASVSGV